MGEAKFALPKLPERVGDAPADDQIAERLGLAPGDIGFGEVRPARFSAGLPFCLVPVRDTTALESIVLERRGWADTFPGDHSAVYVFTETPNERGNDYAARMFHVAQGAGEDAATGSAAAALIGLLSEMPRYGDGHHTVMLRQGREMGRPSLIEVQFNTEQGQLRHAGIGGSAVVLAEGVIDLDE
jgi:trans-2,3-dihydro-3-hydroxyanthranilate isomerase